MTTRSIEKQANANLTILGGESKIQTDYNTMRKRYIFKD